jgi:hypothetical protein
VACAAAMPTDKQADVVIEVAVMVVMKRAAMGGMWLGSWKFVAAVDTQISHEIVRA